MSRNNQQLPTDLRSTMPQFILLACAVLLLVITAITGILVFQRQQIIDQQSTFINLDRRWGDNLTELASNYFQLGELLPPEEATPPDPVQLQTYIRTIASQVQSLATQEHNSDLHPETSQHARAYQAAWEQFAQQFAAHQTLADSAPVKATLRSQLQQLVSDLPTLLRVNQTDIDVHVTELQEALAYQNRLLLGACATFLLATLLMGYSFFYYVREQRHAERALQLSEQRHRALLEAIPDIVLRRNRAGIYTDYKPAKTLGHFMPRQDVIGKHVSEILPPTVAAIGMAASEQALQTGEEQRYEYQMPHRQTGQLRHYEARTMPSGPDEVQVVVRDITEEKVREGQLQQAQRLESLGVLAGGIAHDFNNLLTGMMVQISLVKSKLERGLPALEQLDKAALSTQRAAELVRQLLAYAGKGKFQIAHLDLNQLIRETCGLIEAALPNRTQLHLQLSVDLPLIEADLGQIQQIVMNLVFNATEALQEHGGFVEIATSSHQLAKNDLTSYLGNRLAAGSYVMLQVKDNGIGMAAETLDHIFEPFFSTKKLGHGLGLSAVLGIMRAHRGGIQVQSTVGVGTTFTLLFPAAIPTPASPPVPKTEVFSSQAISKPHVLVIDDEPTIGEAVADILQLEEMSVTVATSGEAGVKCYQQEQHQIGLVLLDMKMPGMSGKETLRALRQLNPQVKVIMSSGYNETEIYNQLEEPESVTFLPKPYDPQRLLQTIQSMARTRVM